MKGFLLAIFLALSIIVLIDAQASGQAPTQAPTTQKWFMKGKQARGGIAKGNVVAQGFKGQNAEGTADKANLQAQMNGQGNVAKAGRVPGQQQVQGTGPKGKKVLCDRTNKDKGSRSCETPRFTGQSTNTKVGSDTKWVGTEEKTKVQMNSVVHRDGSGKIDKTSAEGSKHHKYQVDPATQDKASGKGTITMDGTKRNYQNTKTGSDTQAQLSDIKGRTYTCQGQKVGISNCVDDQGKKVGEVVTQPDGSCVVKKTVSKGVDLPVGKCSVKKDASGKATAVLNDGLFQVSSGNYKQRDCTAERGGKAGQKVQIQKPFTFKWNSQQNVGGRTVFNFPDCVTFGGTITLPPGVDASRLALQWIINVLPVGQLKCVDPGSCNKNCYYCDLCTNSRKAMSVGTSDARQACNLQGGKSMPVSVTACPPPENADKAMCTGFTKNDMSYWQKKGDIEATLIIYERAATTQQLKDQYYNSVSKNGISLNILKAQFAIDNKNFINANSPTDFDLAEYYVKKNAKPGETVIGCITATDNYTMTGQKIKTNFLLEAGGLALAPKSVFDTRPCPAVDAVNKQQADEDRAEAASRAGPQKPNPFSQFFGKRRRRSLQLREFFGNRPETVNELLADRQEDAEE